MSNKPTIPDPLIEHSRRIASEAETIGRILGLHSDKVLRTKRVVRGINAIIGVGVIIATLVPTISSAIGPTGVKIAPLVASIALILNNVVPMFIGDVNPELAKEYSRYLYGYATSIRRALADKSISKPRLQELLTLAEENLKGAKSRYARIIDAALLRSRITKPVTQADQKRDDPHVIKKAD